MASNWTERRGVVTGLGVVSPLANDCETFWNHLLDGRCGVDKIASFDASGYDTQIAAEVKNFDPTPAFPSPKEIRRTDRYCQFGVHAGWQALRDSGLDLEKVNRDEVGVFFGSGIGGLRTTAEQHRILLERGPGRLSPFMIPMLILNMASGLFSIYHRLRGPNFATCSACATSSHALGEAWRKIKMGDAQGIFAGGAGSCRKMGMRNAGLNPEDVSYINAHGTSTPQGDIAETQAIKTVFGEYARKLAVSSTKGATGHMLGAAGAVEMAVCAKALQTDTVPPTINYAVPDPNVNWITYLTPRGRSRSRRSSTIRSVSAGTMRRLRRRSLRDSPWSVVRGQ